MANAYESKDKVKSSGKREADKKEYDILRSKPLRYFGLANEVFKSLKPLFACGVGNIGGIITLSYIFSDVFEKSRAVAALHNKKVMTEKENDPPQAKSSRQTIQQKVAITATDALIWQTLASVLFPGIVLDAARLTTCRFVSHACASKSWVRTAPALISLALIPFIIDPIDHVTDDIMENSYRKLLKVED